MPAFAEFVTRAFPDELQRVWGVPFSEVATPAGRVALVFVHPLILLCALGWSVARGSDCVSGEIGRGTMEMLLAQPVRRITVYTSHALVTIGCSALLALAVWCGTIAGMRSTAVYEQVSAMRYIAPSLNLFGLMVCMGGMSALASSWDSQRWRTIGLVCRLVCDFGRARDPGADLRPLELGGLRVVLEPRSNRRRWSLRAMKRGRCYSTPRITRPLDSAACNWFSSPSGWRATRLAR